MRNEEKVVNQTKTNKRGTNNKVARIQEERINSSRVGLGRGIR